MLKSLVERRIERLKIGRVKRVNLEALRRDGAAYRCLRSALERARRNARTAEKLRVEISVLKAAIETKNRTIRRLNALLYRRRP